MPACPRCGHETPADELAHAHDYLAWRTPEGACPACVQQQLLRTLLEQGDAALHRAVQTVWPLDPEAAFGALPTPLRLHADPRFAGRGVGIALIDSGFHPHPDLTSPHNRIRAWSDQGRDPEVTFRFPVDSSPRWPGWDAAADEQWHGTMTSVVAAGNGRLSHGLYRSLAPEADVVLLAVRDKAGRITNETIARALEWVLRHREEFRLRVVNLSCSGDAVDPLAGNPVDRVVARLVEAGVTVVAAAGNSGVRALLPPATAPDALTVGGIDDQSLLDHRAVALWHSNYGETTLGAWKPELVAPSIWVAAPVLPGTAVAVELAGLFARRRAGDRSVDQRLGELKAITPHYQHADGTSFAAPLTTSAVAGLLEANPALTPAAVRAILLGTAQPVAGASRERQGAGVLDPGRAVARALAESHGGRVDGGPSQGPDGVRFRLHDHVARTVEVYGGWNDWSEPLAARAAEPGLWESDPLRLPVGRHPYKFCLDGIRWVDDPANPRKQPDGVGGLNATVEVA
ncbi:MAG: S8 family serine peptidase [Gemmatimonadota bacterium]|nr:S8 family serine peptidase [Gemmatimonadota bacterium]